MGNCPLGSSCNASATREQRTLTAFLTDLHSCGSVTLSLPTAINAMASASQEFEEDELLAAFNTDQEYDYENELGTQIPIDMGEIEESESTAMSADLADHNVPENFVMEDLPKNTSTEMLPRLHDNEDVVDAEGYSPDTADLRTPNKM